MIPGKKKALRKPVTKSLWILQKVPCVVLGLSIFWLWEMMQTFRTCGLHTLWTPHVSTKCWERVPGRKCAKPKRLRHTQRWQRIHPKIWRFAPRLQNYLRNVGSIAHTTRQSNKRTGVAPVINDRGSPWLWISLSIARREWCVLDNEKECRRNQPWPI